MNEYLQSLREIISIVSQNPDQFSDEELKAISEYVNRGIEFVQSGMKPLEPVIPEGTEMLWELSKGNPGTFVHYLQTVPDPALNNLLMHRERLTGIIRDLSERHPPQPAENAAGIEQAPLQSSNIWGFSYDPQSKRLMVRFQGGGIYQYEGVMPHIFRIFQAGAIPAKTEGSNEYGSWWIGKIPSLGAAFYELIRNGGFPYERVA